VNVVLSWTGMWVSLARRSSKSEGGPFGKA
jgi:hypothetical protein